MMAQSHVLPSLLTRWRVPLIWLSVLGLYVGLLNTLPTPSRAITWVNNVFWFGSALAAAIACAITGRSQPDRVMRAAWFWLASASASWAIGQLIWAYYQLALHIIWPYATWPEPFYLLFAPLSIIGLLRLAKAGTHSTLTLKHVANLALLTCFFQVFLTITLIGPIEASTLPQANFWIAAGRCMIFSSIALVALFLLWSYRHLSSWRPIFLIAVSASVYAAAEIVYIRELLFDAYRERNWTNAIWVAVFGFVACAANEQNWIARCPPNRVDGLHRHRDGVLEAAIPGMLLALLAIMVLANAQWRSSSVLTLSVATLALFAVVLGVREAWIQRGENRLLDAMAQNNAQLRQLNSELSVSEERHRRLNDVLDRRVTERTSELQCAYQELETFSYAVAHDLKAPLRSIEAFGGLLAEHAEGQLDLQGREYLRRMRGGAVNLARLIDDLLAYAHLDRREWRSETVELRALVQELVEEQRPEIVRLNAQVAVNVTPIFLKLNREGLTAALRNLLQNALKYSRHAAPPRIEIGAYEWDGGVRIAVRDNGIGFDMSYHDQIFQVFKRLHRAEEFEGTGIGLAIVRRAVEQMHGRIWADSRPGDGAAFFIELPRSDDDAPAATHFTMQIATAA